MHNDPEKKKRENDSFFFLFFLNELLLYSAYSNNVTIVSHTSRAIDVLFYSVNALTQFY